MMTSLIASPTLPATPVQPSGMRAVKSPPLTLASTFKRICVSIFLPKYRDTATGSLSRVAIGLLLPIYFRELPVPSYFDGMRAAQEVVGPMGTQGSPSSCLALGFAIDTTGCTKK